MASKSKVAAKKQASSAKKISFYLIAIPVLAFFIKLIIMSNARRVGMADCPATPLSEPDWRISHPALWTIFQNAKLICEPEAAGRWCFNHWPSSEFRRPMNHAKPYALWTPKRALLCHTPRLLHAVLAAVPSLAPFRTKCRNRNRGRFCCRMAIARTRRRTCASSPLQLRIASWSQIRKYAPHPSM